MSFVKLQDGRSVYALDSIRLRSQREANIAPQANTVELYIKNGILYQINDQGIEQQIGIPSVTTAQKNSLAIAGVIVYDKSIGKHQGFDGTTWNDLY